MDRAADSTVVQGQEIQTKNETKSEGFKFCTLMHLSVCLSVHVRVSVCMSVALVCNMFRYKRREEYRKLQSLLHDIIHNWDQSIDGFVKLFDHMCDSFVFVPREKSPRTCIVIEYIGVVFDPSFSTIFLDRYFEDDNDE